MSKTYFAKKLEDNSELQQRMKALYAPSHKKYIPQYKLYLCSRDIQVGDKVFNTYVNEEQTVTERWNLESLKDSTQDFKVIGEISPEAIWVKEGDEFDREQFQLWANNGEFLFEDINQKEENIIVAIKCPTCQTFH